MIFFLDVSLADMESGWLQAILINVLLSFRDFMMSHDDLSTNCSPSIWQHSHCVGQMHDSTFFFKMCLPLRSYDLIDLSCSQEHCKIPAKKQLRETLKQHRIFRILKTVIGRKKKKKKRSYIALFMTEQIPRNVSVMLHAF